MEKFKLDYLHIADGASPDQLGKLSIYGIFEKVILGKIPGKLLKFVIVGSLKFGKNVGEKINLKIKIVGPNKHGLETTKPVSQDFLIDEKKNRKGGKMAFIIEIGNLEFKKAGEYRIAIYANKNKIGLKKIIVTERGV